MITVVEGDITETGKDIIVQQVNCRGRMGAGLAKTIMQKYNNVRGEYIRYWADKVAKVERVDDLLGQVNYVNVDGGKVVANVFGQVELRKGYKDKTVYTEKWALLQGIKEVKEYAEEKNMSIAIPTYIGCGLAGGNWEGIQAGIEEIFEGSSVNVALYHYR